MCYQGHRRYLADHHPYRRQKLAFNGEQELQRPRPPLSGEEEVKKSKKVDCPWKKKSFFFELEYWKFHHVCHCLDVMYIEKNVCDNLMGTLLNMRHKSKDSEASRRDMLDMGVRADLAPQVGEKKTYLPSSIFTLSKAEKRTILSSFLNMKLSYGHVSNIKNYVSMADLKIYGLKSHDCHILLQQLLPVAIRSVLPKHVRVTIIRLCFFFNSLCSKVVDVSKLDKVQSDVILTLCELEKKFHASFFDVMIHLIVHLVWELRLCGPVCYRWTYVFERFNKVTKSYVKNCYHPEGCIAESYLGEESVEFCTEFLKESCKIAGVPKDQVRLFGPLSVVKMKEVDEEERDEAHLTVLLNNSEVRSELKENRVAVSEMIRWLAAKPSYSVLTYEGYLVDGVRDLNSIESDMMFYGIILEIWELDYHAFKDPLFLCKWASNDKGIKVDDLGFTLVDFSRQGHKKDKYVSVDQVKQVFYVEDPVDATWSIVLKSTTRDYHDIYNEDDLRDTTMEHHPFCSNIPACYVSDDIEHRVR
ncbi:uncharacterized protein LOC141719377 [Apium graveolens]|uniref:uncharacterized protein LOC141719377 n=1 Tax=Apium graveolens TaxID=4045 RepID=UPI003D7BE363